MADFQKPVRDQVIVVTGASSGLGKGIALACARQGACVVLASRQSDLLDALASECETAGGTALAVPADVGWADDVAVLAQAALARFGRIDAWINNAGVGAIGVFETVPLADHAQVLQTNLLGTLYGSYAAVTQFKAQGSGVLINIASMLGRVPAPYYASYNMSKSGIIALGATLRDELQEQDVSGVHVCTVLPMALDTPFFQHAANYTGHEAVPIPPVYDVQKAVDAVVDLLDNPVAETIVGGAGLLAEIAHRITPNLTERLTAVEVQKMQMEAPLPAAVTTGTLYHPTGRGTGVHQEKKAAS